MDELEALVANLPDEILDYIEDLEGQVETYQKAATEAPAPAGDEEFAKALETLPEDVAAIFKSQADRLAEAEAKLEAEQVAKATAEWTTKARSFDGLVDKPEEFGEKLRQVAEIDAELADSIVEAMRAANTQVTKGALFAEIGHSTPVAGSVDEKVSNIAKALREAHPDLSEEAAVAKAWEDNPDLYDQHVNERRAALKEV